MRIIVWLMSGWLCLLPPAVSAQLADSTRPADLLRIASVSLRDGDLEAAERLYRRALEEEDTRLQAWRGLGRVEAARNEWGAAADWFSKVADVLPEDPEANYYRGISRREAGKFKALFLRMLDFRASEKHFRRVIAVDSLFKDVWYQLALLERYREHYLNAVNLTRKQIELKPALVQPRVKLYRFYDLFIEYKDSTSVFAELAQGHGAFGTYFRAEKLRRLGHLDSARTLFEDLLANPGPVSRTAIYQRLARIAFERGETDAGELAYWHGIRAIADEADAELAFQDIKYILSDEEYERYLGLELLNQKRAFFSQVWKSRDPFPASPDNPRLVEHYRRLIFAERWYRQDEPHRPFHAMDLSTRGTPRVFDLNEEFHQKGLVYIRWGQPDDKAVFGRSGYATYESWIYQKTQTQPKLIVHFANPEDASPTDWRISLVPPPEVVWDMGLESWDPRYHSYATARTELDMLSMQAEIEQSLRRDRQRLLREERMVFPDTVQLLPASVYWASLKGPGDTIDLNLYYGVAFKDAFSEKESAGTRRNFESGFAAYDTLWSTLGQRVRHFTLTKPEKPDRALAVDAQTLGLEPGVYNLTFYIRDQAQKRIGSWRSKDTLKAFPADHLSMSDLTVAVKIAPDLPLQPGRFVRNGVVVAPNPTRAFLRDQPVYVYYEIYGLAQDDDGVAHCRVTYTLDPKRKGRTGFLGLFGSRIGAISVTNEFDPTSRDFPVYTALDVSRFSTGQVDLRVRVTDLVRQETVEKSIPILLAKD